MIARSVLVLLTALALPCAAGRAWASSDMTLEWEAPPSCPDKARVVEEAARLLGSSRSAASMRARGKIVQHGERYVLELSTELGETRGFRRLEAARCEDLTEPAALVVALAIDPDAALRAEPASPAPTEGAPDGAVAALPAVEEPPAESPPSNTPAAPSPLAPPPAQPTNSAPSPELDASRGRAVEPSDSGIHARIGAAAAMDSSTLPGPAVGAALWAGAGFGRLELEARGALYASQTEAVDDDAAGQLGLSAVGIAGCYRLLDRAMLALCAGGEAARLSGKGVGVSEPGSASVWLFSGLLGLRAAQPIAGPVRAFVRIDAAGLVNRPRFVLENVGVVHQPARFGGRGALGAEVSFP